MPKQRPLHSEVVQFSEHFLQRVQPVPEPINRCRRKAASEAIQAVAQSLYTNSHAMAPFPIGPIDAVGAARKILVRSFQRARAETADQFLRVGAFAPWFAPCPVQHAPGQRLDALAKHRLARFAQRFKARQRKARRVDRMRRIPTRI